MSRKEARAGVHYHSRTTQIKMNLTPDRKKSSVKNEFVRCRKIVYFATCARSASFLTSAKFCSTSNMSDANHTSE